MIEWVTQYWYLCLLALIIGLATAAWIWLRVDSEGAAPVREIDELPTVPLEPVRPIIDIAERVDFAAIPAASPTPEPLAPGRALDGADGRPAIAAAVGEPDDLGQIKGIGPKLKALLASLGITRLDQIAAWTKDDIAEVDRFLGTFQGRITRDAWVEQAGYLARGDTEGFSARFGALGGER